MAPRRRSRLGLARDCRLGPLRRVPCRVGGSRSRPLRCRRLSKHPDVHVEQPATAALFGLEGYEKQLLSTTGEWERRSVKLGLSDAGYTQVKSGVQVGETVSLVRQAVQR
jgi:hypothetical protein